jgi:hypothetical protein
MTKYLREAVEKTKQHYIQKLFDSGIYSSNEIDLYNLTLSELKEECKKSNLIKKNYH